MFDILRLSSKLTFSIDMQWVVGRSRDRNVTRPVVWKQDDYDYVGSSYILFEYDEMLT